MDAVAAPSDILNVQRLVYIAHKMDNEFRCLSPSPRPQLRIEQLRGIVLERADNAAVDLAIALEIDAAVRGRVVLGVDEVEVLAEASPFGVPDAVGPGRDAGEVVRRVVPQQLLEISRRLVAHKVAGDICDCDMTQATPGDGSWQDGEPQDEASHIKLHDRVVSGQRRMTC